MYIDEIFETTDQSEKLAIAYHEAGHAVMGYLLEVPFEYVTVEENDEFLGHVRFQPDPQDQIDYQCFKLIRRNGFRPLGFGNKRDVLGSPRVRSYVESHMLITAAGCVAEFLFKGEDMEELLLHWDGGSDCLAFVELAESITGSEQEYFNYFHYMLERTWNIMSVPAHELVVDALANQLLVKGTIGYSEACAIIKSGFDSIREDVNADSRVKILEVGEGV